MTEDEAKTKWCPMVRLAWRNDDASAITANRWGHGEPLTGALCIGSACMMWRWEGSVTLTGRMVDGSVKTIGVTPPTKGLCGLAGY